MNKLIVTLMAAMLTAGAAAMPLAVFAEDAATTAEPTAGEKIKHGAHKAGRATKDTAITAEIKTKLAADSNLSAMDIHVDTKNGVVTLTGAVDRKDQVDLAEKVVKATGGVKSVENKLDVKAS